MCCGHKQTIKLFTPGTCCLLHTPVMIKGVRSQRRQTASQPGEDPPQPPPAERILEILPCVFDVVCSVMSLPALRPQTLTCDSTRIVYRMSNKCELIQRWKKWGTLYSFTSAYINHRPPCVNYGTSFKLDIHMWLSGIWDCQLDPRNHSFKRQFRFLPPHYCLFPDHCFLWVLITLYSAIAEIDIETRWLWPQQKRVATMQETQTTQTIGLPGRSSLLEREIKSLQADLWF